MNDEFIKYRLTVDRGLEGNPKFYLYCENTEIGKYSSPEKAGEEAARNSKHINPHEINIIFVTEKQKKGRVEIPRDPRLKPEQITSHTSNEEALTDEELNHAFERAMKILKGEVLI